MAKKKSQRGPGKQEESHAPFTATQGQYLAYLHLYRKLHRCSPAESDIAKYFRVSPPSVHQMIVKLEEKGLIARQPGVSRSIRVALPPGEIPPLDDDEDEDVAVAAKPVKSVQREAAGPVRLYTLCVFLFGGPVSEEFTGKEISRTIQIRGDQTLEDLHRIIFQAYNRFDEHFYEFQFGKGPQDPDAKRYVLPEMIAEEPDEPTIVGDTTKTTIGSLGLKCHQAFGYWFDYGDDWWHQINVDAIDENVPSGKYPKVIKRVGKSPPQYLDGDD